MERLGQESFKDAGSQDSEFLRSRSLQMELSLHRHALCVV